MVRKQHDSLNRGVEGAFCFWWARLASCLGGGRVRNLQKILAGADITCSSAFGRAGPRKTGCALLLPRVLRVLPTGAQRAARVSSPVLRRPRGAPFAPVAANLLSE